MAPWLVNWARCSILADLSTRQGFPKFRALTTYVVARSREVLSRMAEVITPDDEDFQRALKRFQQKCEKAGIPCNPRKLRRYLKLQPPRTRLRVHSL